MPGVPSADVRSGESASGHFSISGGGSFNLPLNFPGGVDKSRMHLKLGPIYLHFDALTASLVYTNTHGHPTGSSEDWDSLLRTGVTVVADLGERFSVALQGEFWYLPFKNQVGFGYAGELPIIAGQLSYLFPSFHAQVAYTTPVGAWDVTVSDDLELGRGRYSDGFSYTFADVEVSGVVGRTESTVYTFARQSEVNAANRLNNSEFGVLVNTAGIKGTRDVPGSFVLETQIIRKDLWYIPNQSDLQNSEEQFMLQITSARENLRFKPFLRYTAEHIEGRDAIDQQLICGVFGPITENMNFFSELGYFAGDRDGLLGMVEFDHVAGPSTTERLRIGRSVGLMNEEFQTTAIYEIIQTLGPQLAAKAFVSAGEYETISGNTISHREVRTGVRLTYTPGPRTAITWSNYYGRMEVHHSDTHSNFYGSDVEFSYALSDTLEGRMIYAFSRGDQYQEFYSSAIRNAVYISLRKYFR